MKLLESVVPTARMEACTAPRYEIMEKLGQGGSGTVYKAMDRELERPVAIKRLTNNEVAQGESRPTTHGGQESLRREALALSALQHPNIVTIHDIGADEDGPFVVMEYLEGQTLEEVIENAPLPLKEFTQLVRETLLGLGAAHARNILHRDLKPANIMLVWLPTGGFQFKILDFGIAKSGVAPSQQTMDAEEGVMGSIHFMAPEQFERLTLDARTDLYALGCTFFHALTGRYAHEGETMPQIMAAHLHHTVGPLAELRPDLPQPVVDWVLWLMNRLPDDRPASAAQALASFEHILQQSEESTVVTKTAPKSTAPRVVRLPATALPQSAATPAAKVAPRPFPFLLMGVLVTVAAIGAAGIFLWQKRSSGDNAISAVAPVAPASQTSAVAAAPPDTNALPPTALADFRELVSKPAVVEGVIVSMGESKAGTTRYLNFSRAPGQTVSLAFRADTDSVFPRTRLATFIGQKVRGHGVVADHRSNLVIYIEREADLVAQK